MTALPNNFIKGDRALNCGDGDKLGFRDVAKRISASLVDQASQDGLVIGVEGAWGSGKSSLLFLIREEIRLLDEAKQPSVINFRPWLIGNRDALITALFSELSNELDKAASRAGNSSQIYKSNAEVARNALYGFMVGLSKTGATIEVVGDASGLAPLKWLGKGAKALGDMVKRKPAPPQLSALKDKLVQALRDLNHRFIVTIDDVDRLEPAEVIEILRLVRSVVDLPNVIYILCYDSEILAQGIERSTGLKSGKAYLEKIIQLTVMVPKPEPLQLRQWFSEELHQIASVKNDDELARLQRVIDYEGGRQLRTPRSVVRCLDAIRFFWPALRSAHADLADLVWLQLIKDGNPKLYRWIEEYCATAAAVSVGAARIEGSESARELAALFETVPQGDFDDLMYRHYFAEQLPGFTADFSDDGSGFAIFELDDDQKRDDSIRNRRLGSPDHYRLYFALAGPSHALTYDEYSFIWAAAAEGIAETGAALLQLHGQKQTTSLTKADILLERIRGGVYETLSGVQCENFLIAFSNVMDEAYRLNSFDHLWVNSLWDRAEQLIPLLISGVAPEHRDSAPLNMFREGEAIGWLTTLFRKETFAHGRYGERPRSEGEWLFTNVELDRITEILLGRYRAMSALDVFSCPEPLNLLFAWKQGGDEQGPSELLKNHAQSNEGFIEVLENLMSTIHSSDRGRFMVLKKEVIAEFMDFEEVYSRLNGLKDDPHIGERACHIEEALKLGAKY